eukprot:scaffold141128_cov17-Prasinocladus_malaysianus.AAC.2
MGVDFPEFLEDICHAGVPVLALQQWGISANLLVRYWHGTVRNLKYSFVTKATNRASTRTNTLRSLLVLLVR